MRNAPTGLALSSEAVQLMDADGDGRVDLVMNAANFAGYYSLNHDGEWDKDSFRKYDTRPPVNLQSAQAQFMDLSGDGRTDVLINADRFICYFQNSPLLDTNRGLTPNPSPGERGLVDESRAIGWSEARFVNKAGLDDFPNVNFGDPRIRTADMSGDGLADIVQIHDGGISYWPNLGYGRFGKRRLMRNSPRLGYGFNPAQLILGDADGDGQTDVIYVERNQITVWFNQSGNGFSDPVTIQGTPSFTNRDSVRMVDLFGTGTPGILWSYELGGAGAPLGARMMYLDLCGGIKPYVMVGMRNNLGARTRVQYGSSVSHYLRDAYKRPIAGTSGGNGTIDPMEFHVGYAGKWKTTLPFPVQVVDRVEVIDEISKGKLTTRYFYHHGYWDGGEREFRGFGRVDQFDTETFERYNEDNLVLEGDPLGSSTPLGVSVEHYAPPVLAKNWFHLGPVGAEKGDWKEVDFANEYWSGDANMLQRDPAMLQMIAALPRRARRDAFRTLRGTALRSELYAIDGSLLQQKPYTVSETQTGLRLVASPNTNATIRELAVQTHSNHIFFSFGLSSRSTTWERGTDPMTKFSFTGAVDDYGQPLSQVSIAVPRGKDPRTGGQLQGHSGVYDTARGYDATIQFTEYIYKDPSTSLGTQYMVDRAKQTRSFEARNDGAMSVFALRDIMLSGAPETWTGLGNAPEHGPHLLGLGYTYYDGNAFDGAGYGVLGAYGVPVRSETLMIQPDELTAAYGTEIPPCFSENATPDWSAFPTDFVNALQHERCGYVWRAAGGDENYVAGYYTSAERSQFDFHVDPLTAKGLPVAMQDVFGHEATIEYDDYQLLPVKVTDPVGMETSSEYDYRVLQPERVTDPNLNISTFAFTPLGLMHKTALLGKGDNSEGDTLADPGVLLEYDLFAFKDSGAPVWVKTTQRVHHINADYLSSLPSEEQDATIIAVEYSDGFGRQLQTRTQAEDLRFGDALLGDSGLPADQTASNAPAIGVMRDANDPLNVVVSGAKVYNNKGEVVEQWEPYFGKGFGLNGEDGEGGESGPPPGQRVRIFFDALGRPKRTVNPDGTEQRVVYGVPNLLNTPDSFKPSPWERYTYDANDLAPITHPGNTLSASHHWTPKSELVDALGPTVRTVEHITTLSPAGSDTPIIREDDVVMRYAYDIKGQLLEVRDPLDRVCFEHKYDIAGNNLWTKHLDSGEKKLVVDAQGNPLYSSDAKGAAVYTAYDDLHRPTDIWAKDASAESVTLRQHMLYGDSAGLTDPELLNLKGQLVTHYDEAGKATITAYDFKGNPLEKVRQVIADSELTATEKYVVDWGGLAVPLDAKEYVTGLLYDGLNRVRKSILPEDVDEERKEMVPSYNRAGALEAITFDGTPYVRHIAYNAKGQRVLLAMGNGMMTRYAYDAMNYRLLRIRTERYEEEDHEYDPQNGSTKQDCAYEYDLGGSILKIKERVSDCGITGTMLGAHALDRTFQYDPLKRLLQATGRESNTQNNTDHWNEKGKLAPPNDPTNPNAEHTRAYTQNFQYDKVGNILQLGHQADSNNYNRHYRYATGINHLEQLDNNGGTPTVYADFTYDEAGNQLTINTDRFFEWDAADQLRYFKIDDGTTVSVQAHYLYAGGDRVKKLVRDQQGNVEVTVYIDGVYEHRYRKDSVGDVEEEQNVLHVMDGRSRIATVRLGDAMDDPGPPVKYNLEDHLGTSTTRLTDDGTIIDREEYYPFGESSLRTFEKKRYRYVGKELDSESGLYYYGARYYAAWVGRFISVDPLAGKYAQLAPYNYAGNRPIGDLDIDGLQGTTQESSKTDVNNSVSQSIETGDKVFDFVANTILTEAALHGIEVEVTHGSNSDGTFEGTIQFDGNIIHYNADRGFTQNGREMVPTNTGYLVDPAPIFDIEGRMSGATLYTPLDPSTLPETTGTGASSTPDDRPASNENLLNKDINNSNKPPENKNESKHNSSEEKPKWIKDVTFFKDLVEGYLEKTKRLFEKAAPQLNKAVRAISKIGKGIVGIGIILTVIDAMLTKEWDWKAVTKLGISIGIVVAGILGAPVVVAGLVYGVLDYFGVVDYLLDEGKKILDKTINFWKNAWQKTKEGISSMSRNLRYSGRPF
jgi:RHS repeat-associated protein